MHLGLSVPLPPTVLLLSYASPRQFANRHDVMLIDSIDLVAAISAQHIVTIRQTQEHLGLSIPLSSAVLL